MLTHPSWRDRDRKLQLDAGGAVDALAQQIRVAEVARVLLDHVQVDQPERHDLAVALWVNSSSRDGGDLDVGAGVTEPARGW